MPAQLVVVADNRSLGHELSALDIDVVDLRPVELADWLANDADPPVLVVVGVEHSAEALGIVTSIAGRHPGTPMLVAAGTARGWDRVVRAGKHVSLLKSPVTSDSLLAAVHGLITVSVSRPSAAGPVEHPDVPDTVRHIVAARSTDALRERLAHRPVVSNGAPAHADAVFDAAALRIAEDEPLPASDARRASRRPPMDPDAELRRIIGGVLACVDLLYDVRDVASAVLDEAFTVADASRGVVMLRDGDAWRVVGAGGVRPLDWRYSLEPESWLVTTVVTDGRGIIVEDTDIARQRLGGAPLSHLPQLMAVPIPAAGGLVLIAREEEPFTVEQLGAVADIAAGAGVMLADALQVRELARALSDFRGNMD